MKITYITDSIIPSRAANSVNIMKMCQAFSANGHEVTLLLPNQDHRNLDVADVHDFYGVEKCFEIIRVPFPKVKGGIFIFSLLSAIKAKKDRSDLIYTRFLYACFLGLLMKLPTIFEIHSPLLTTKIEEFVFSLIRKNKLSKIVVISRALSNILIGKYKVESKVIIAPDGADPVNNCIKSKEIRRCPSKLEVGYVGHLYKGRGIDIIAKIASRCPWVEFHIVGGLPKDVDYWKKELVGLKNVIFYGHVPHKKVYGYMLSFDVLIAPYQEKVFVQGGNNTARWMSPLKIFEYMAVGKPILSSDLPVLREVLRHNENSLLAPPRDIEKWISNLELIKNNDKMRHELGERARKKILRKTILGDLELVTF